MATARRRGVDGYGAGFGIVRLLVGVVGILEFVGTPQPARADLIVLRGGGQVQGKVVPDPKDKNRVQILLLQGRRPLSFEKSRVLDVIAQPTPLDGYVVERAKAAPTAAAQFALATWCERNRLPDLAKLHYE